MSRVYLPTPSNRSLPISLCSVSIRYESRLPSYQTSEKAFTNWRISVSIRYESRLPSYVVLGGHVPMGNKFQSAMSRVYLPTKSSRVFVFIVCNLVSIRYESRLPSYTIVRLSVRQQASKFQSAMSRVYLPTYLLPGRTRFRG